MVQALLKCGWTTLRVAGDADVHFAALDLRRAIDGLFALHFLPHEKTDACSWAGVQRASTWARA